MMFMLFFSRPWMGWFFLFVSLCSTAFASEISLGWDPEAGVAGYIVYYGTESGNYTNELDLGTNACVTINGLQPGLTYYFAISSYDTNDLQSPLSGEISYLVPGLLVLTPGANPGDPMILSFPETPGDWYEVQASPDLINWATFWVTYPATANDWVQVYIFNSLENSQEFYRLTMH